jgi:hypothetical protein
MKYNIGDLILVKRNPPKIAIVLEPYYIGTVKRESIYNYKVLFCGIETPSWIRGDEIVEKFE